MPIPMGKVMMTTVRIMLRPINNFFINWCKQSGVTKLDKENPTRSYQFFVQFGQVSNRFEVSLNRVIIQQKGLGEVKSLLPEVAFNKGIDYFTEILFFYGVLFGISFYQIDQSIKSSKRSKKKLKEIDRKAKKDSTEIEKI